MVPPPGIGLDGKILRLDKALYSLKQAPLAWFENVSEALAERGLFPSLSIAVSSLVRTTRLLLWYMLMTSLLPDHDRISIVSLIIFVLGSKFR